jgi:hypothetical protein
MHVECPGLLRATLFLTLSLTRSRLLVEHFSVLLCSFVSNKKGTSITSVISPGTEILLYSCLNRLSSAQKKTRQIINYKIANRSTNSKQHTGNVIMNSTVHTTVPNRQYSVATTDIMCHIFLLSRSQNLLYSLSSLRSLRNHISC